MKTSPRPKASEADAIEEVSASPVARVENNPGIRKEWKLWCVSDSDHKIQGVEMNCRSHFELPWAPFFDRPLNFDVVSLTIL